MNTAVIEQIYTKRTSKFSGTNKLKKNGAEVREKKERKSDPRENLENSERDENRNYNWLNTL